MGTPNDQAVLQAIFNPDSPFGDIIGLDPGQEAQKEVDEGEYLAWEDNSAHRLACFTEVTEKGSLTRPLVPCPSDDNCDWNQRLAETQCTGGGLARVTVPRGRSQGFPSTPHL